MQRLQQEITFPSERRQSQLLPLLPQSTTVYAAFPNYADVTRQALKIFREARETSPWLRDWWQRGQPAKDREDLEALAEKFAQVEDYLGDEVVFSARLGSEKPGIFAAAEVRKPGLELFLRKLVEDYGGKTKAGVLIFTPQELAAGQNKGSGKELLILVHPNYVAAAQDFSVLRSFQEQLGSSATSFAGTPFGQRLGQEYTQGTSILAGADLQKALKHLQELANAKKSTLEESGFADAKFAIWGHTTVAGQTISRGELSFTGPRRGPAAWLAKPQPLTTLDFVSPKAVMAATIVLTKPEKIFDDAKKLSTGSPSSPFKTLSQFETMLSLSLRDDVLRNLQGELTLELDDFTPAKPVWRAIFKVNDTAHLESAFNQLLAATQLGAKHADAGGTAMTQFQIPSRNGASEIAFAFADGHLIVGPNFDAIATALKIHKSGASLAKSKSLQAALPPGHTALASALFYQDPVALYALQLERLMPGAADAAKLAGPGSPSAICLYGDEAAIRSASKGSAMDAGVIMVIAAVAIPNLLRSRIAANEASAVGSLRTINTAMVTYATAYPTLVFASTLRKLGPNRAAPAKPTSEHAGLLDESLAGENCTSDGWCSKSGYRFDLKGDCRSDPCIEYVVTATPVKVSRTGMRSFCSTADGIIRMNPAAGTLLAPLTVAECKKWQSLPALVQVGDAAESPQ